MTGASFVTLPQTVFKYRLVECGCTSIHVPPGRFVVYTRPTDVYVPEGPTLGLLQQLIPSLYPLKFSGNADNIFSPIARNRVVQGKTIPISSDFQRLRDAKNFGVSLLGTYAVGNYVAANTSKPFLTIGEVSEQTVLGRAEYIKLLGLLFHCERRASWKFDYVRRRYNKLRNIVQEAPTIQEPHIFFNYPFLGKWTQPAQFQYTTSVLLDAGADYLFKNDGRLLGQSLTLEEIVAQFKDADVLVNSAFFPLSSNANIEEFINQGGSDARIALEQLKSVEKGNVWSNSKRVSPNKRASDFFESAAFRADLLLRDYIQIVRPDVNIKAPIIYMYKYRE